MTTRDGIFAGDDPLVLTRSWLNEAAQAEVNDPNAVSLATVDGAGMPNVRVVLLKEIEDDAFVCYTNFNSPKAQEAIGAGKAAFVMYWKSLGRQVRVRGLTEKVTGAQADAYFATRHPRSRAGAVVSQQSQPLDERATLIDGVDALIAKQGDNIPRPENWGGIRIRPLEIEFWANGENRLHDRFRWTRDDINAPWGIQRLYP